jgi:hypothetical protein
MINTSNRPVTPLVIVAISVICANDAQLAVLEAERTKAPHRRRSSGNKSSRGAVPEGL